MKGECDSLKITPICVTIGIAHFLGETFYHATPCVVRDTRDSSFKFEHAAVTERPRVTQSYEERLLPAHANVYSMHGHYLNNLTYIISLHIHIKVININNTSKRLMNARNIV